MQDPDNTLRSAAELPFNPDGNGYPVVDPALRLHYWPDRVLVFGKPRPTDAVKAFELGNMTTINDSVVKIFDLCDGTRTVVDIANTIAADGGLDLEMVATKLTAFLGQAVALGHVEMATQQLPSARRYEVTGSREHYYPIHATLELTNKCNLKCRHCYRLAPEYVEETLTIDEIKRTIDDLAAIGVRHLEITGGEITTHPQFFEAVSYACSKMSLVGLLSNGTLLREQHLNGLEAYRSRIFWSISLDSCDREFYDAFRGVSGMFDIVVRNIKALTSRGFLVKVAMSVVEDNIDHIIPTMDFARNELDAFFFGYSPVVPVGRAAGERPKMSPEEANRKLRAAKEHSQRYKNFVMIPDQQTMDRIHKFGKNCGAGWRSLTIGSNGKVRPCVMIEDDMISLGCVRENSLKQLVEQEIINSFRRISMPHKGDCSFCANQYFCTFCIHRGVIANINRVQAGLEPCEWAKKQDIGTIVNLRGGNVGCHLRACTT